MTQEIQLIKDDPWLEPYQYDIASRLERFEQALQNIETEEDSLEEFANAHNYLGLNYDAKKKGWWYREWAPGAYALSLVGDFNNWDKDANPLEKKENGVWETFLADKNYKDRLVHESLFKVHVIADNGSHDRLPSYVKKVVQNEETYDFAGQVWNPEKPFKWSDGKFSLKNIGEPVIYECHVGMAQEKEGVGTYREFADEVLPRIQANGYNVIQMMAVQEHPYYGSFGYHVSNFFAPSSRFGTPEDLKYLINKAHKAGIAVIMDIVHSHAVKNFAEGLNNFDGTEGQYFHEGGRGYHTGWDSKLFNYGKREVKQFLLSNVRYWLEEFHFDGYRFDGVTSMLYMHHGDHVTFDHYDKYFKDGVEWDAVTYLQLANELIHRIKPEAISIAEDMSGMPGLCRKNEEGGLGFDYRLGMGIPDYWIKLLKHSRDEDWNLEELWHTLVNRRWKEKTIAYAESHDQALVGDKTLAFWLMDKEMYWHMNADDPDLTIERGIALHKMIRLITMSLGGEGYLNFIGNEFGHPEWVDFPREGNGWSYKHARRQWHLVDNENLKYKWLNDFDRAMINTVKEGKTLAEHPAHQLNLDAHNKVVIFKKGDLIYLFNFSPTNSIEDYRFYVPEEGKYEIILNSDSPEFGGHGRVDDKMVYKTIVEKYEHEDEKGKKRTEKVPKLSLYLTNRTALVLKKVEKAPAKKTTTKKAEKPKAKTTESKPKATKKVAKPKAKK